MSWMMRPIRSPGNGTRVVPRITGILILFTVLKVACFVLLVRWRRKALVGRSKAPARNGESQMCERRICARRPTDDPDAWYKRRGEEGVNEIVMVREFAGFLARVPDLSLDDAILLFENAETEFPDDLEAFARSKGRSAKGYREGASPFFAWGKRACAVDGGKHLEIWLQNYAPSP